MHCQTLPDPENTPVWSFSLSLSLPRRLGPIKAGLTCLLSLTDAIHPEGTPWILLGLDPGSFLQNKRTRRPHRAVSDDQMEDNSVCEELVNVCILPKYKSSSH